MSERVCSIEGCESAVLARTWCSKHYQRWRHHGDPLTVLVARFEGTAEERWDRYTEEGDAPAHAPHLGPCLIWTGPTVGRGYGWHSVNGKHVYAHRHAYEAERGAIPEGMQVDHVCHRPACVRSSHLRVATRSENQAHRRGAQAGSHTGLRGVTRVPSGRFRAYVKKDGRITVVGTFDTAEEADAAATAMRRDLFGEFAGGSKRVQENV